MNVKPFGAIISRGMSSKPSGPSECKFGTLLLRRTIPSSSCSGQKQPPNRIAYRIIRPGLLMSSAERKVHPLIVIHGGPSLPSEYLTPLAENQHLRNRAIILYDQLGCGWSSTPRQNEWYGVLQMSQDLDELVKHLGEVWMLQKYHLLAHSLGGAIGYEFLKRDIVWSLGGGAEERGNPQCLSFILSNASTNFQMSSSERNRLFREFQALHGGTHDNLSSQFDRIHVCRTPKKPAELKSALTRRGKDWSANDYTATPVAICPAANASNVIGFPPVLVIRGQYDFVTQECTRDWKRLLALPYDDGHLKLKEVVLSDCAHYPHFEQPERYSYEVERFCSNADK
ncbi:hypothetical protein ACHAWF_018865 [Thalassiosira exigua]